MAHRWGTCHFWNKWKHHPFWNKECTIPKKEKTDDDNCYCDVRERSKSLGFISHFHLERNTDWTFWGETWGQFNDNKKINVSARSLGNYCTAGGEGSLCVNGCWLHCWNLKKQKTNKQTENTLSTGSFNFGYRLHCESNCFSPHVKHGQGIQPED